MTEITVEDKKKKLRVGGESKLKVSAKLKPGAALGKQDRQPDARRTARKIKSKDSMSSAHVSLYVPPDSEARDTGGTWMIKDFVSAERLLLRNFRDSIDLD